jgi:hypothetical protein
MCMSLEDCFGSGHAGRHHIERLDCLTRFGLTALLHSIEGSGARATLPAEATGVRPCTPWSWIPDGYGDAAICEIRVMRHMTRA